MKKIEKSGLDKALIQKIIDQADTTKGEIPVVVNGETYIVNPKKEYKDAITPDCSEERCNSASEQICECCKKYNWPIGYPVLVCDAASGNCCYCHCR